MEDGNLMDKVTILIQRDMEYYKVIGESQKPRTFFVFVLAFYSIITAIKPSSMYSIVQIKNIT